MNKMSQWVLRGYSSYRKTSTFRLFVFFFIVTILDCAALRAQDTGPIAPLTVGWTNLPPLFFDDESGGPTGFSIELMERISDATDIPLQFVRYDNIPDLAAAYKSGEAQIAAGLSKLPFMEGRAVYSQKIVDSGLVMVTRSQDRGTYDPDTISGVPLGLMPGGSVERLTDLIERNFRLDQPNVTTLLMELLRGRVDAILTTPDVIFAEAYELKLDHRIAIHEKRLSKLERFVGIHNSRKALLPTIEEAIASLERDGALEQLRRKYFLELPKPEPDILRVGVWPLPPYQFRQADGSYTGLFIDYFDRIAELANIRHQYVEVSQDTMMNDLQAARIDLLLGAPAFDEREIRADKTITIDALDHVVVMQLTQAPQIESTDDLAGVSVGYLDHTMSLDPQLLASIDATPFDQTQQLLAALEEGRLDAAVGPREVLRFSAREAAIDDDLKIALDGIAIERDITLRAGLGSVRERLNAVISGFVVSTEHNDIRAKWLNEPIYWTEERARLAVYIASGGTIALVILFAAQFVYSRLRHVSEIEQMNAQLSQRNTLLGESNRLLTRSNQELDSFAYIASHDLKEPLRALANHATFLHEDFTQKLGETGETRIERMKVLCGQMAELIDALFYYSRLGRTEPGEETVDVEAVICNIRTSLADFLEQNNAEILIETELPKVTGNQAHVDTVFRNLITNGVKYNDSDKKTISIGCRLPKDKTDVPKRFSEFYVTDNGIGIDEKFHDEVYRIFKRLNSKNAYGEGTGSGLTFARKIVELHGGSIHCQSCLGAGSTFSFSWPVC